MTISYRQAWNLPKQLPDRRVTLWGLVLNALVSILIVPAFRIYGFFDVVLEHLRGPHPDDDINFNWSMELLKRGFFLWLKALVTAVCWLFGAGWAFGFVVMTPLMLLKVNQDIAIGVWMAVYLLVVLPLVVMAMARLFRTGSLRSVFQVVPIVRFAARNYFKVLWCTVMFAWLFFVLILGAYFTLGYFAGWAALAQCSLLSQLGRAFDEASAPRATPAMPHAA